MDLNRANRQCCDLDIRDYKTLAPFLFADFCNTTTAGFSGDSVYAMKKGSKAIAYHNPIEGTMSLEFQCHPFKVYALLSDGTIETTAVIPVREEVTAATATLTIKGTPKAGTVFVYADGDWGGTVIEGTIADKVFTPKTPAQVVNGKKYLVGYLEEKTSGVKRVSFNNKKVPKDVRITMQTVDKNELGQLVPCLMTAYHATVIRNLELSFSSEGDPATITIEYDCLEDMNGDVLDIVEIEVEE